MENFSKHAFLTTSVLFFGVFLSGMTGYQSVAVFPWVSYFMIITFFKRIEHMNWWQICIWSVLGWALLTGGQIFAWARTFPFDSSPGIVAILGAVYSLTLILFMIAPHLRFSQHWLLGHFTSFVFPTLLTTFYFLIRFSPVGDYFNLAYTQLDNSPLVMVASFFGADFICFLVVWCSSVIFALFLEHGYYLYPKKAMDTNAQKRSTLHIFIYFIVLFSLLGSGGFIRVVNEKTFYQEDIKYRETTSIKFGCASGPNFVSIASQLAQNGAQLVMSAESAVHVQNRTVFLTEMQEVAKKLKIFLGIGYQGPQFSNFALINDDGYLLIDYSKSHPIPGVDTSIVAGPNKLQWGFSRFGRIGVGIGYDFNFPSFISQASTNQIALMLQPDASWGPVARYHAKSNAIRSVENGFSTFRCASPGDSGIFTSNHEQVAYFSNSNFVGSFIAEYPLSQRTTTFYGFIGQTFSWICLSFSLLYYCLILPDFLVDPVIKKVFCAVTEDEESGDNILFGSEVQSPLNLSNTLQDEY